MNRILRLVAAALVLAVAAPAMAEVQTGSILVRAVDEQGSVVPGVTVTIASAILPQPLIGTTDSSGVYRIPGMSPGTYTVTTSLAGFQTVIREAVSLVQGQTLSLEI